MRLKKFRVTKFRNIVDSGWVDASAVTALVGQNEAGKSNLFEALFLLNPYTDEDGYRIDEDWPMDDWPGRQHASGTVVAVAQFELSETDTIDLNSHLADDVESDGEEGDTDVDNSPALSGPLVLVLTRAYEQETKFKIEGENGTVLEDERLNDWAIENAPKFVLIADYGLSNTQIELSALKRRRDSVEFSELTADEQTMLIVLDLADIDIDQVVADAAHSDGRTTRTLDTISASAHLSQQFHKLWSQKRVDFDIRVDGDTLNIFAKDVGTPMPVRLKRRSTGFRWYTSFAWKFTHASSGQYEGCVLLLEEPGIHLHYQGQRDLLETFELLSEKNDILYTTHLSSMVDQANPERVHIVESRNHHAVVNHGVVSSQQAPMAVIEASLGLTSSLSGMLGSRKILIVEGGIDSVILNKLSGLLRASGKTHLSDQVYIWVAQSASKTPMYAAFAIGQKWDAALLLDSDQAGNKAKEKINEIYLHDVAEAEETRFRILMLRDAAGITKTDVEIEDLFPDDFYRECVNRTYSIAIRSEDLPQDGSTAIVDRVGAVLKAKFDRELDKKLVLTEMLRSFDGWNSTDDLPPDVENSAEQLFSRINTALGITAP